MSTHPPRRRTAGSARALGAVVATALALATLTACTPRNEFGDDDRVFHDVAELTRSSVVVARIHVDAVADHEERAGDFSALSHESEARVVEAFVAPPDRTHDPAADDPAAGAPAPAPGTTGSAITITQPGTRAHPGDDHLLEAGRDYLVFLRRSGDHAFAPTGGDQALWIGPRVTAEQASATESGGPDPAADAVYRHAIDRSDLPDRLTAADLR